ncbi:MAG: ankyrin repeat domain-containing protein, partial [Myxococcota bacterium]
VEKGAKPSGKALQEAIFLADGLGDDMSAVAALVEGGAPIEEEVDGLNALGWAASINYGGRRAGDIVKLLLEHGADPNVGGNTPPVHVAIQRPAMNALAALLEGGADPNVVYDGCTPIVGLLLEMRSAFRRDEERDDGSADVAREFVPPTLGILLKHGADARIPNRHGKSPLLLATLTDSCPDSVIIQLCEAGAITTDTIQVNEKDDMDLLAYSLLKKRSPDVLRALIDAGLPLNADYALFGGGTFLEVMLTHELDLCEHLWDGSETFRNALVQFKSHQDANALALCAMAGNEKMVRALHAAGVSANETMEGGITTLALVENRAPKLLPLIQELASS